MDKAHEDVCGPAVVHLLKRALTDYGDAARRAPGRPVMTVRANLPSSDAIEFPIRFHQSPLLYIDKGQVPPAVVEGDAELRQS